MSGSPYLKMQNICKSYAAVGIKANDDVTLHVHKGEIHMLTGDNGAGKSTLMNILFGLERPDSGDISINGHKVCINSPADATKLGIGMVHQHFKLIDDFTVLQNVILGAEPRKAIWFMDNRKAREKLEGLIEDNEFSITPELKTGDLTMGQKQQTEILKALYRDSDILILDEPTSILSVEEVDNLCRTLKNLAAQGKTIILITHNVKKIEKIADRRTVLQHGHVARSGQRADEVSLRSEDMATPLSAGEPFYIFEDRTCFDDIRLTFSRRQIIGITGENDQALFDLENMMSGMSRMKAGRIVLDGKDITGQDIRGLRHLGLGYVPSNRLDRGSSVDASIDENLKVVGRNVASNIPLNRYFGDSMKKTKMLLKSLSGGNIQKIILARELEYARNFALLCDPFSGLDRQNTQLIEEKIREIRDNNALVVIIATNIDHILGIADRILMISHRSVVMDGQQHEFERA